MTQVHTAAATRDAGEGEDYVGGAREGQGEQVGVHLRRQWVKAFSSSFNFMVKAPSMWTWWHSKTPCLRSLKLKGWITLATGIYSNATPSHYSKHSFFDSTRPPLQPSCCIIPHAVHMFSFTQYSQCSSSSPTCCSSPSCSGRGSPVGVLSSPRATARVHVD